MTKLFFVRNLFLQIFLSLAGASLGHTSADKMALYCQNQQQIEVQYTTKWDMNLERTTLQMTQKEDGPFSYFSLLIDFKRNQGMYSEEGAWKIMDITANDSNKINFLSKKDDELGSDIDYINLDRDTLRFKAKFILDWDSTTLWKTNGQCRIVRMSDVKGFPEVDKAYRN